MAHDLIFGKTGRDWSCGISAAPGSPIEIQTKKQAAELANTTRAEIEINVKACRQMEKMALLFPEEFWEEAKAVGIEPPPSVRIDEPVSPYSDVYAEVLELILEQAGAE